MKVAHLSEPAEERVVFRDGLGVRERRETDPGEVVEWFHLDPAFAGVEQPLRDRVARLTKLQHVKFARIFGLEPASKGRGPILVSSHVAGARLAEVLEMAGHGLLAFDPGAGLQVTREVLGGLAVLHDSRNVAHGSLAPERVVLTPSGRVVMVEHVLAQALDRLQRPRHQLWREWRIATPPAAGPVRLDMQTDLAQVGLLALAALLGRPLEEAEYPHKLRGLLPLVQDRLARSPATAIGGDVMAWLDRLVPVDSRRAFRTVREAQQAFEGLFSAGAAAMGVSPARVKGVMATFGALSVAPPEAPAAGATIVVISAPEAPDVTSPGPLTPLAPTIGTSPAAMTPASAPPDAESDIDIEALLRLEAELEGGTTTKALVADQPSLEALVEERHALERQFADLVASVAPSDDAPVHLIPEVPATSESLVDARVLWSSMPVDDAPDALETPFDDVETGERTPLPVEEPPVSQVANDAIPALPEVVARATDAVPFDEAAIEEVAADPEPPAGAIEHVPAEWWKDALPWRAEGEATAADTITEFAAAEEPRSPVVDEAASWTEPDATTWADEVVIDAAAVDLAAPAVVPADIVAGPIELAASDEGLGRLTAEAPIAFDSAAVEDLEDSSLPDIDAGVVSADSARDDAPEETALDASGSGPDDDASVIPDVNLGGQDATEPVGTYRLFEDIEPIALPDGDDVDPPMAASPFDLPHVDATSMTAAASLFSHQPGGDVSPDWRHAFLVGATAEAPVDEVAFGSAEQLEAAVPFVAADLDWPLLPDEGSGRSPSGPDGLAVEPDGDALAAPADVAAVPELAPESPAEIVSAASDPEAPDQVGPDAEAASSPMLATAVSAVAESVSRRKKKRSRRKKGAQADTVPTFTPITEVIAPASGDVPAPVVETPAVPVRAVVIADSTLTDSDPLDLPAGGSSLLEREVPSWTPPTDLAIGRAAVQLPAARLPAPPPEAPGASHPFEQDVRAVGMPDLEELAPRLGRTTLTSMADDIGPSSGPTSRPIPIEPRVVMTPEVSRGMNWRRLVAASVLIALFQGVAFAAWWWVQPGARGTLVVQTSKIGVEVLLDDKVVGRTPFREEIAPGRHKLGLRQGRNVREMPVEISVGVVTTQAIAWPSLTGGRGNLQVTSSPSGAEVFINGKSRGQAPVLLEDLPAGDHALTLRSDAGTVTVAATVVPDDTTPVEAKIFAGWVLVDAPVELNLLLNGRSKIGSSMDGQILLPPGTHRVQAINEGLGIREWFSVTVEPGAVRRVPFTVPPATLTLDEEAEVFVDGTSAGTTPGTITIQPGTHDIVIRPAAGVERRQSLTVRSKQRIEF